MKNLSNLIFIVGFINFVNSMPSHSIIKRDVQNFPISIKVLNDLPYRYGRKLNVECTVTGSEDEYEMEWVRENALTRHHVTYKSYNKILMEIKNMIPMDFGSYKCKAVRKSDGVTSTNTITFKRDRDQASGYTFEVAHQAETESIVAPIIERPKENTHEETETQTEKKTEIIGNINNDRTIKILEEFQTYTHEGETVKFTCEVEGVPNNEIKWEKNMADLPENHEIVDNVLILENVRPEDTGYYICAYDKKSASVFLGVANKEDPITIVRIQSEKKLVNTKVGNTVQLDCSVVGDLPTRVWWQKHQSSDLPDNHQIDGNKLILENIMVDNFGYYECFGENEVGTFSDFIYLDVEEEEGYSEENYDENYKEDDKEDDKENYQEDYNEDYNEDDYSILYDEGDEYEDNYQLVDDEEPEEQDPEPEKEIEQEDDVLFTQEPIDDLPDELPVDLDINQTFEDATMVDESEKSVTEENIEEPLEENVAEEPLEENVAEEPLEENVAEEPLEENVAEEPLEENVAEEPLEENVAEEHATEEALNENVVEENDFNEPVNYDDSTDVEDLA